MDLLAHLAAYVAVVDEASFSRAADRLGIAQPLLSRRVKTLEEHFGGVLFDRSRRQVTTTEFGLSLLPYARDVLDSAQRLRQAARASWRSAVRAVGVPADCDPAALARVLRAGTEHGTTVAVRELPPGERVTGLADGSLAYALVRGEPENAALRAPLGLASAPPPRTEPAPAGGHPVHLEDLRPRRGTRTSRHAGPVLTLAEDQLPGVRDRLARAAARAGLPESLFRPAASTAAALAETLAGRALLLCTEPFATRHGAFWAPLYDQALHRGYDVRAARRQQGAAPVPGWLAGALAASVGAVPHTRVAGTAAEDPRTRLAALG
jgi:DNA-binding transcriptional LysR family regulator